MKNKQSSVNVSDDTVSLNPHCGQFLCSMEFPIQSCIQDNTFYVHDVDIWNEWEDFIFGGDFVNDYFFSCALSYKFKDGSAFLQCIACSGKEDCDE